MDKYSCVMKQWTTLLYMKQSHTPTRGAHLAAIAPGPSLRAPLPHPSHTSGYPL